MRDFKIIKSLIGEGITEEMLKNVDCYAAERMGLFIPALGQCGYAARPGHTHPSYMVVIYFGEKQPGANHYRAEICSPDIPHNDNNDNEYYCILIDKAFFEEQYLLYDKTIPRFEMKDFEICGDVLKSLNSFAFEYSKAMPNSDITLSAQAMIITHWIIRSILGENFGMRPVSSDYTIARAQHYIEQHYSEKLTAQGLAALSYISVSSFNRRFKAETGQSPAQYIIDVRIEKSKVLLRRKNISMTDVAQRCGFGSGAYFSSCFISRTGLTPSEYQERYID
ncbi:MAG: helix-turn-helix domain-containing protein [Candidatus Ornithomonoglobus sp.]